MLKEPDPTSPESFSAINLSDPENFPDALAAALQGADDETALKGRTFSTFNSLPMVKMLRRL